MVLSINSKSIWLLLLIGLSTLHQICVPGLATTGSNDDFSLLYGGILVPDSEELASGSHEAQTVVNATLQLATKHGLSGYVPGDELLSAVVSNVTKKKLVLTYDGISPAAYLFEGRGKDGRMHVFRRRVYFGILYSFNITWRGPPADSGHESSLLHHFTVNRDLRKKFYIYEHRVLCQERFQSLEPGHCDAVDGHCSDDRKPSVMSHSAQLAMRDAQSKEDTTSLPWQRCQEYGQVATKFDASGSVTVLSYNIWNFNSAYDDDDDYQTRVTRLGHLCRQRGAAIIAFQEVRFDFSRGGHLGHSQTDHLSSQLHDYQFVFQAAMTYPEGRHGRVEEGPAIFSVYPIISSDYVLLPRNASDEQDFHQRILLHAEISTPQLGPVHVFVTHLSLSEAARNRSVVAIWRYMRQFEGLLILAGDLNAEPHTPAIRYLAGLAEIEGSTTEQLRDAWTAFHKEPRPAAPDVYGEDEEHDLGLTFSTLEEHLVKRIDYLFYRSPPDVEHTATQMVDDGGRGDTATSDHLGVEATFRKTAIDSK